MESRKVIVDRLNELNNVWTLVEGHLLTLNPEKRAKLYKAMKMLHNTCHECLTLSFCDFTDVEVAVSHLNPEKAEKIFEDLSLNLREKILKLIDEEVEKFNV